MERKDEKEWGGINTLAIFSLKEFFFFKLKNILS